MNPKIEAAIISIYKDSIKNPPKTLDGHIKNENGITNDYRGRAIYEFFQNAIDRAENKIWIHLNKPQRTLTVANDGLVFSIEGGNQHYSDLESLCSINTSSKNQNESIGNKGVGFKSCWEYTQKVSVCSIFEDTYWGFELHNPLTIDKIITPIGVDEIEKWKSDNDYAIVFKNNDNRIPSFYFPMPIENAGSHFESLSEAVTVIKFHDLTDEKLEDLEKKIIEFSEHQIFFVQQIDKLNNSNVQLELQVDDTFKKTLNTQVNSEEWLIESYEFKGEQLDELQKLSTDLNYRIENPKIAIAFPLKQHIEDNQNLHSNFYCYVPTEVKCGFNVLIHGNFLLDVSRKHIDFENNPYNEKLLGHIAKLFVDTLQNRTELHNLSYFGKFLLPYNRDGKIEMAIKKELFDFSKITSILKKVYTKERAWGKEAYSLIFDVIDNWKRNHNSKEIWDYYFDRIYRETIRHFCDLSIYIVPIFEGEAISFIECLPPSGSSKKLFYRKDESLAFESSILKELQNFSITSFDSLDRDYFKYPKVVKPFSNIEILRAINNENNNDENEISDYNQKILKFVSRIILDVVVKPDKQGFLTGDSLEHQLSKIKLPCIGGTWQSAIQCYTGIDSEISVHFNNDEFFEVDKKTFNQIISGEPSESDEFTITLKKFGIWQSTLPFQYKNGKLKLPFTHFPQLKNNLLKALINNSIPDFQNLAGRDELIKVIKSDSWFFDEANKSFAPPSRVFLFNDQRNRKCIAQERKTNELEELYRFFNIEAIEDSKDVTKLTLQLELMKTMPVDENHKTVYKQLVMRISKLNPDHINDIPLLLTNGSYCKESCWFVPSDQRSYVYLFKDYKFVNFDINTALGFIDNLKHVNRFEPEFIINSKNDELIKDTEIKHFFETTYLTDFFALAEVVLTTSSYDKEEVMKRWNNLEIYKADDVWLDVIFDEKKIELYRGVKTEVLYKPVSKSDRETKKELVGLLAYDIENYTTNFDLPKFGFAIADAVFRNQNFGDILSNYILKKQNYPERAEEYLRERGIGEKELIQTKKFIEIALICDKEMGDFINAIAGNNGRINKDNWTEKNLYSGCYKKLRFHTIEKLKSTDQNTSKFESLLELINPFEENLKFLIDKKNLLQICYYACNNEQLSNEVFDKIIKDKHNVEEFYSFDFNLVQCYSILGIPSNIDSATFDKAKSDLCIIDIQKTMGLPEKLELIPIISNGISTHLGSAEGKSDTHTVKRTYQQREELSRSQHNRGIGLEKILSLKYAQQLIQANQLEYLKEHIHQIKELESMEIPDVININIETLAKILQVSSSIGDGLGYDVLQPVFHEGKLIYFNRVEIKSSKSDLTIFLSESERLKILHFTKQNAVDWKLYHFVDGKAFDRTESVSEAIKTHAENYSIDQQLVAENWFISFPN